MNILITGGLGYLGGRLGQYLHQQGHRIFLGTRHPMIMPPAWLPNATVVQTEWHSDEHLQQICHTMEVIIHAAGMNAQHCTANPVEALMFNGVATARLLQAAISQQVKRFIYVSTAHVYGSPLEGEINEISHPANLHPYASSHRAGEDTVLYANQHHDIEGIVVRLSNAYGTPTHKETNCWSLLVNHLCRQAIIQKKMVLHSSGTQRRDFVPLSDVCRAMQMLILAATDRLYNPVVNIGGQWAPTIREMASLIQTRCQQVLNFYPELSFPISNGPAVDEPCLEYRMDVLTHLGFKTSQDRHTEIDRLLDFCRMLWT